MARDNSPKVRNAEQLQRKLGRRASYDRILIVTEGSKTEPNYFNEIRAKYRLHTANVVVQYSQIGTSPIQVVQYAEALFKKGDSYKRIQPRAFEQVYAVFDRDDHQSYFNALEYAAKLNGTLNNDLKRPVKFKAIASVPCFELWLLLHYEDIQASLHRDEVMRRLKQAIPGYAKGSRGIFAETQEHVSTATQRANRLNAKHSATNSEPYTAVAELVELLTSLAH
jgi:hypothetical protein